MSYNNTHEDSDKNVEQNGIIYLINLEKNTAGVIGSNLVNDEIIIPRLIRYESTEYIVTSIVERAFYKSDIKLIKFPTDSEIQIFEKESFSYSQIEKIKIPPHLKIIGESSFFRCIRFYKIEIPSNSELQTIENNAFNGSSIENFTIPPSLIHLKKEWCGFTYNLKKIDVSPDNKYYKKVDEKLIIGKSSENFDTIFFADRDIEKVTIPNYIKHIEPYAFGNCMKLQQIEIQKESMLQTIGENAFYSTSIEHFTISSNITNLYEGWCQNIRKLIKIDVSPDNRYYKKYEDKLIIRRSSKELDEFDTIVFCDRDAETIKIPSFIKKIESFAFNQCDKLQVLDIPNDSEIRKIGKFAFCGTSIKKVKIPFHLTEISESSFSCCNYLEIIEIPPDSDLEIIGNSAFCGAPIESFKISHHIKKICENAFDGCYKLRIIEIPSDSELQIIDSDAFYYTLIENLSFPSSLFELKEEWCLSDELKTIEISPNNQYYKKYEDKLIIGKSSKELDEFDTIIFCDRNVESIIIPNFIKHIQSLAFYNCQNLREVKFQSDSKLKTIEMEAFCNCNQLQIIEIPQNSDLQTIEYSAFYNTLIENLPIPSNLIDLKKGWCNGMNKLKTINISLNNKYFKKYGDNLIIGKSSKKNR